MNTSTARTQDAPMTSDGRTILFTIPPGVAAELRPASDGSTLVVERTADAAGHATREALEAENRRGLDRIVAAAGGARA